MDVKLTPPTTTTQKPALGVEAIQNRAAEAQGAQKQSQRTDGSVEARAADTSQTSGLQELGLVESRKLHEELIMRLRDDIRGGSYVADMDVVAERVAEVLGVA